LVIARSAWAGGANVLYTTSQVHLLGSVFRDYTVRLATGDSLPEPHRLPVPPRRPIHQWAAHSEDHFDGRLGVDVEDLEEPLNPPEELVDPTFTAGLLPGGFERRQYDGRSRGSTGYVDSGNLRWLRADHISSLCSLFECRAKTQQFQPRLCTGKGSATSTRSG
jgi:hypothetical protein